MRILYSQCSQPDGLGSVCKVELVHRKSGRVLRSADVCAGTCGAVSECKEDVHFCDRDTDDNDSTGHLRRFILGCKLRRLLPRYVTLKVYK